MQNTKTQSDMLFETYLDQHGLTDRDYEPSIAGKTRHMDYRVTVNNRPFFFEVEEFTSVYPVGSSYDAIRGKINEARLQFKQYKEYCCSLVLGSPHDTVGLTPDFVLGAMLGDVQVAWEVPSNPRLPVEAAGRRFGQRGKMIRPNPQRTPQNTSFSAVIIVESHDIPQWRAGIALARLERKLGRRPTAEEAEHMAKGSEHLFQDVPRVIVFENPDARLPLPRDLFVGAYDERWGRDGADIIRVFAGDEILQLESEEI